MNIENFVVQLFKESINVMKTSDWKWPEQWNTERQLKFLNEALSYGEKYELYEQCSIIRDVKKEIEK